MAATIFLVRHAAHDRVDRVLCGRMPGVGLGEAGRRQAEALARRFADAAVDAVWTSPLDRARETAEPIAGRLGLPVRTSDGLCGDRLRRVDRPPLRRLARRPAVAPVERGARERAAAPGRVDGRIDGGGAGPGARIEVERARAEHPDGRVVLISHGDVIKAVLAGVLGLPLDAHARFEISPASVSALAMWEGGGKVLSMNESIAE